MKDKLKRISALLCAVCFTALSLAIPVSAGTYDNSLPDFKYIEHFNDDDSLSFVNAEEVKAYFDANMLVHAYYTKWTSDGVDKYMNSNSFQNTEDTDVEQWFGDTPNYATFVYISERKSDGILFLTTYYYNPDEVEVIYSETVTNNFYIRVKDGFETSDIIINSTTIYRYDSSYGMPYRTLSVAKPTYKSGNIYKLVDNANYTTFHYDSSVTIYDENGEIICKGNTPEPKITSYYEENGVIYIEVTADSENNCWVQLDLFEGNYDNWIDSYNVGDVFDYKNHSNIYRHNWASDVGGDHKINMSYTYDAMLTLSSQFDKGRWWVEYFNNHKYSKAIFEEKPTLKTFVNDILLNTATWNSYWKINEKEVTVPNYNFNNVKKYLKSYIKSSDEFNSSDVDEFFYYSVGTADNDIDPYLDHKNYTADILVYNNGTDHLLKYGCLAILVHGNKIKFEIPIQNIDYKPDNQYIWVLTTQKVNFNNSVETDNANCLVNPLYADNRYWYSPDVKYEYIAPPFGNGIDFNHNNLYDDNNNLYGEFDSDGNITMNPDNPHYDNLKPDFSVEMNFDTSSPEALFNSCTNFFVFLKMGFSILPAFIWSLIGTVIFVIIFLRVIGR